MESFQRAETKRSRPRLTTNVPAQSMGAPEGYYERHWKGKRKSKSKWSESERIFYKFWCTTNSEPESEMKQLNVILANFTSYLSSDKLF